LERGPRCGATQPEREGGGRRRGTSASIFFFSKALAEEEEGLHLGTFDRGGECRTKSILSGGEKDGRNVAGRERGGGGEEGDAIFQPAFVRSGRREKGAEERLGMT